MGYCRRGLQSCCHDKSYPWQCTSLTSGLLQQLQQCSCKAVAPGMNGLFHVSLQLLDLCLLLLQLLLQSGGSLFCILPASTMRAV